jgi:hypothetical protein
MRMSLFAIFCILVHPFSTSAEVTKVTVTSRTVVAGGQAFGATGPYEKLVGRIEFAVDPADPHNKAIVDLQYAQKAADGRVHFASDLYVLRPVDAERSNGVLLFEISNRGGKGLLTRFNGAPSGTDPMNPADFGNGFLMREGYTLVWVGWEFDVAPTMLKIAAPAVRNAPAGAPPLRVQFIPNRRETVATLTDAPMYPPADPRDRAATLTVRNRFWDPPTVIARERWQFVAAPGTPRVTLEGGFEPGRIYEVTYRATGRLVAGAGLAAIRDAASAFRYRTDLPFTGRVAYVFGASQSGRFLRVFLHDGFNADERDRRVFDAVWPHIAGAAGGSFNEPFATPTSLSAFTATRFPFTDLGQKDAGGARDGLLSRYKPDQLPKVVYTNTPVEYWGLGRAAALTHTSLDGLKDVELPENVRIYLLAGSQHGESAFPPSVTNGQQLGNPTPQREVMRALLFRLDQWVRRGIPPPASRYPRLSDHTLVPATQVRFPALRGIRDPRTISGPARAVQGKFASLPFLVPQVDADGNEIGGIRVPDLAVPLATTTGWNFRAEALGNAGEPYALLGSYIPFAATRAEREARKDPRPSIEERYASRDQYVLKIHAAAADLIKGGYLMKEDLERVLVRAYAHWDYATRNKATASR